VKKAVKWIKRNTDHDDRISFLKGIVFLGFMAEIIVGFGFLNLMYN